MQDVNCSKSSCANDSMTWDPSKHEMPKWGMTEDVVITGISGRFPECNNMEELKENLLNNVDMVTETERRWLPGIFGTPRRMGTIKEVEKLDANFFGIHPRNAADMAPQIRLLLEVTYEAMADAGYEANSLRGENIGVFVGNNDNDSHTTTDPEKITKYWKTESCNSMFSNTVSFIFDFKGPSYTIDNACASSMTAFQLALLSLRTNQCSAAIVAGTALHFETGHSVSFHKMSMLSEDGKCKFGDANANGFVRAESIVSVFLQRKSAARRIYATVVHAKCTTDGAKSEGITFPSCYMQRNLLMETYIEAGIDPKEVAYVEAHGTGTAVGDPQECYSFSEVFCNGRKGPLIVGSVKTNLGHSEAAAGVNQLAKVIISMEENVIPANLHYSTPNPSIPPLVNGDIKIITENTIWNGGLVGICSYGFGGSNVHVILESNNQNAAERSPYKIPRLVVCCGRTKETTENLMTKIKQKDFPDEALVLLEEIAKAPLTKMPFRGYTFLQNTNNHVEAVKEISTEKREVWFAFSGMGSQRPKMAKEMMSIDIFAKSIKESADLLKPFKIDLINLLVNGTEEDLQNIVASFVTIVSVQIALIDLIRAVNIVPDGYVGHSIGELGCAYASGCFTAEQTLLSAYWRGKISEETSTIYGSMAAIGLTWEESRKRCPEGVFPACHNSENSVTIAGPHAKVATFVKELQNENIFAKEVKCCNIAFHSKYVSHMALRLQHHYKEIISCPKRRHSKWISSSVPETKWNDDLAQFSSSDYFLNNLLSPVLFYDAMAHIPKNAIVIEFAPHPLLKPHIQQTVGKECRYIELMKQHQPCSAEFFLKAIGKMYISGLNPNVKNLYPPVNFPVPRGTPMISPLISWDHSHNWPVPQLDSLGLTRKHRFTIEVDVSSSNSEDHYLTGHRINGRVVFPATGYICLVWKAMARIKRIDIKQLPIAFKDIYFHRLTVLSDSDTIQFHIGILETTGEFEVLEKNIVVVTGRVLVPEEPVLTLMEEFEIDSEYKSGFIVESRDIYTELRLRGYDYRSHFQGLVEAASTGKYGKLHWENNYVTFMDSMGHLLLLRSTSRQLAVPRMITSVKIDPRVQSSFTGTKGIPVYYDYDVGAIVSGGVELMGFQFNILSQNRLKNNQLCLEEYKHIPHFESCLLNDKEMRSIDSYIQVCTSLVHKIQRASKNELEIRNIVNGNEEESDIIIQSYMKSSDDNYILLNMLKNILEKVSSAKNWRVDDVNIVLKEYEQTLQSDILCNILFQERFILPLLDIAIDNVMSVNVMNVLQISPSLLLHMDVDKMMRKHHVFSELNYTVAHINSKAAPDTAKDVQNILWDIKSPGPTDMDLIIVKNVLLNTCELKVLKSALKDGGFILLIARTLISTAEKFLSVMSDNEFNAMQEKSIELSCKDAGFVIVCKKSDQRTGFIYLLRKYIENRICMENQKIVKAGQDSFIWVNELKDALATCRGRANGENIWVVAQDNISGTPGMIKSLRKEPGSQKIRCIVTSACAPAFSVNNDFYKNIMEKDLVMNVYEDGKWGYYTNVPFYSDFEDNGVVDLEHAEVDMIIPGNLATMKWVESELKYWSATASQQQDTKLVNFYYVALNFKDVMFATGTLLVESEQDCLLGKEFAGRDETGKRIMGAVYPGTKGMASVGLSLSNRTWAVPDGWTLEEASTVPVVYVTAYYALILQGKLQSGESVLIHSGSGGVGLAAIAISLSMGCQVFTTVSSSEKKEHLKKRFPNLTDKNFSDSRSTKFQRDFMKVTKGKGVDVVLNSLSEDKLLASVSCLAERGRFLEIGKYDITRNNSLGMAVFLRNISFHGIDLSTLFLNTIKSPLIDKLHTLVSEGIQSGVVKPLPTTIFECSQIENAFRFMASGHHIGKVVIKIREEEVETQIVPRPLMMPAVPKIFCHPEKSYLIVEGLGGMGLQLCNWLVERGCRKLVISSRSGIRTGYQKICLNRWKMAGVQTKVSTDDVTTMDGAIGFLHEGSKLGPVGAIFNLATIVHDTTFENTGPEDFESSCKAKLKATKYLDIISRQRCPQLEWFVVFSSIISAFGNHGQTCYGYANSSMERICALRKSDGYPSLAIQWGYIGDVGIAYEHFGNDSVIAGCAAQSIHCCLEILETFLLKQSECTVVTSYVLADRNKNFTVQKDPLALIVKVFGLKDKTSLNLNLSLGELGMDSMMGVELMQILEYEYKLVMSVQNLREMTLQALQNLAKTKVDVTEITTMSQKHCY